MPRTQEKLASKSAGATRVERLRGPRSAAATILVVEDEDFVRNVTCEVLKFEGYQVLTARSAVEALHLFRERRGSIQLLLTDVALPGKSGRELARTLRGSRPGLPTIYVSGYPENDVMQRDLPAEESFYLPKPFSVQALMSAVRRVLKARERQVSSKD